MLELYDVIVRFFAAASSFAEFVKSNVSLVLSGGVLNVIVACFNAVLSRSANVNAVSTAIAGL